MDADRRDEITDAALDGELQSMLDVAPSPQFVARVRTRIVDEPSPSRPWLSAFTLAASAVVVAAIVMVAVSIGRPHSPVEPASALDARRLSPLEVPSVVSGLSGTIPVGSRSAIHRAEAQSAPNVAARQESKTPEILVDPREATALRALIFGARQGRIDLTPVLAASTPAVMELPPVVDIDIPAITIEPIAPGTGEEGVRQ
jgi:hypothetical protein